VHSGNFLNQLGLARLELWSVSFPVHVLERYTRSQLEKKANNLNVKKIIPEKNIKQNVRANKDRIIFYYSEMMKF